MTANPYEHETSDSDIEMDEGGSGIKGQIAYPDREVDAEQAGRFAAMKEDALNPDRPDQSGWQNPADRPGEVEDAEGAAEGKPGDETGEETEPEGVGGNPYGDGSDTEE
jgi:hypothetical protein